jgi:formyl-CoA transferase
VLVAVNRDTVFTRLAELMEHPAWLHDDRFSIHGARGEHMAELDQLVSAWTRVQDSADVLDRLHEAGVPAGLIYTAEDMLSDPHVQARQAIVRLMHAKLGAFPMQNLAPRLSRTPGSVSPSVRNSASTTPVPTRSTTGCSGWTRAPERNSTRAG